MKGRGVAMAPLLAMVAVLIAGSVADGAPAPQVAESVAACLGCHEDKDLSVVLKDKSKMALYVDAREYAQSVHGSQLVCTDCHARYDENHPSGATFDSRRAYVLRSYELCKKCHFDTYTRTLESVHYDLLKSGLDVAPICSDCHGAHAIHDPREKRTMVSGSCGACHEAVYKRYARSVHGKALVQDGNQDVPACADCHTHHQIQAPGTPRFRLGSPDICIRCHGDERLMRKYGISTAVATTYLADFHGVTASLARGAEATAAQLVVTCADCHDVHNMASPRLKGSEAMKATVAATCAKCHKGAAVDFPAAWLSHYEPSLRHAPLVFLINLFYKIFIPFVIIGLVLHVVLDIYRVSAGR
jgi:nitrate/TMAO reductase-like tetraheme cytochrome c subunit